MQKRKLTKNILVLGSHVEPIKAIDEGWFAAIDFNVSIQVSEPKNPLVVYGYHYTFRLIGQIYQDKRGHYQMQPTSLVLFEVAVQDDNNYRPVVCSPRFFNPNLIYYLTDQNIVEEFLETFEESITQEETSGDQSLAVDDSIKNDFFKKWFSDMLLGYYNEEIWGDEQIIIDAALAVLMDYIAMREKQ